MKILKILLNIILAIYLCIPMSMILIVLLFMPIIFPSDVSAITNSGFAGPNSATSFIGVSGLFIGLSMLIPPLRKVYRKLPWLHSYVKIMFVNLIILNIGEIILNFGYEIQNTTRHTIFFILMILQIILCRIGMCIYFKLKPVKPIES